MHRYLKLHILLSFRLGFTDDFLWEADLVGISKWFWFTSTMYMWNWNLYFTILGVSVLHYYDFTVSFRAVESEKAISTVMASLKSPARQNRNSWRIVGQVSVRTQPSTSVTQVPVTSFGHMISGTTVSHSINDMNRCNWLSEKHISLSVNDTGVMVTQLMMPRHSHTLLQWHN